MKPTKRECPGCREIKEFRADQKTCGCKGTNPNATTKDKEFAERNDVSGDKWVISLPKTTIRTLDELVEHCKIDLNEWFVERFICNKWEVAMKLGEAGSKDKVVVTPLFQVKAFLRKKIAQDIGGYIEANAKLRSRNVKLAQELSQERRLNKQLALNHCGADEWMDKVDTYMQKMGEFSITVPKPKQGLVPSPNTTHTEDAGLLISDTHFGDRIRREDTSGFPEFNLPISGNRFGYIIDRAKQVLTLHRAMYPIETLYVWVGGDIGNGILHDAPNSNELFTPAQVHLSYHMLKFGIEDLLTLTQPDKKGNCIVNKIKLLFTVGNHMRIDEKMPGKFQAQRTLDWLIYQFLIEKFKDVPNVEVKTEMAPYIFENIRGHRYMFCHGMQVGYRNSPDNQCKTMSSFIDRVRSLFDSPEWRRNNGLMGETFGRVCIGDIHVPVSFPRLLSNGSLNGQNEFGVNWMMEPIPAGQQIFGVSRSHIETWKYFLECTHIQDASQDKNSYGEFARQYAYDLGR